MKKKLIPALAISALLTACGSSSDQIDTRTAEAPTNVGSSGDVNTDSNDGSEVVTMPPDTVSEGPSPDPVTGDGDTGDGNSGVAPNTGTDTGTERPTPANIAARYELTIINLTAGQPLSPPAALLHQAGYKLFALGKPASVGLEMLAEGAATADLLATSLATGIVWTGTASSQGPIGPGGRSTMTVDLPEGIDPMAAYLSAASMLVNTNDAITAVRSLSLHGLNIGSSISMDINSYDTGTEANDEVGAHIPGPAGGGIGFDANRNDIINAVLPHPGVITADDGLDGSALYDIHRWKNPVARLLVRRVQ